MKYDNDDEEPAPEEEKAFKDSLTEPGVFFLCFAVIISLMIAVGLRGIAPDRTRLQLIFDSWISASVGFPFLMAYYHYYSKHSWAQSAIRALVFGLGLITGDLIYAAVFGG